MVNFTRIDPDDAIPHCPKCGYALENIPRWDDYVGVYYVWNCPNPKCWYVEEE